MDTLDIPDNSSLSESAWPQNPIEAICRVQGVLDSLDSRPASQPAETDQR
jgi:hypothetical protein